MKSEHFTNVMPTIEKKLVVCTGFEPVSPP